MSAPGGSPLLRAEGAAPAPGLAGAAWLVFGKELLDALRDRRTLMTVFLSSVAMGPLVLLLVSSLVADIEKRAEARVIVVQGLEHAGRLRNFIERQTFSLQPAPADYERRLKEGKLGDPVLVIGPGFESALQGGRAPVVELVGSSSDQRALAGLGPALQLLQGFQREQAQVRLALRGVAPDAVEAIRIEQRDLADPASRAAQLSTLVPYFVLMALLYGALNAALDTTAGERERGSLEPLLMNAAPRAAVVLGKWAAVVSVSLLIAALSSISFLPGQWLLRSEVLSAMFRYGPAEALAFVALLFPLACTLSALLMAVAIRCRSFKEAQARATVLMLGSSLLPLVAVFSRDGSSAWHYWLPALAQTTLMGQVLKGESLSFALVMPSLAVCGLLTGLALGYVARVLGQAALG